MTKVYLLGKTVPLVENKNVEKLALMAGNLYENEEVPNLVNLNKKNSYKEVAESFDKFESLDRYYSSSFVTFIFGIEGLSLDAIALLKNVKPLSTGKIEGVYNNQNLMLRGDGASLIDFFNEACCSKYGNEVNDIADQMLEICLCEAPNIFKDAGAPCTFGKCYKKDSCEEKRQAKIKQIIKTY